MTATVDHGIRLICIVRLDFLSPIHYWVIVSHYRSKPGREKRRIVKRIHAEK